MFQGMLPPQTFKVISTIVKEWDVNRIYIGCSGNFTIERTIGAVTNAPITGNDVTIYSSYLGMYFAGNDLGELKIKEDYDGELNYLRDYMNSDVEKVATMMIAADIIPFDSDSGNAPSAYSKRMLKAWKEQYSDVHAKLCTKIENTQTNVDSFYHGDVMKMLDEIGEGCGFISFPPFFKGGYEKMWEKISAFFEYEEPEYEMFDPKVHIVEFCNKVKKLDNFVIGTERLVDELSKYYAGESIAKTKSIYFYSKTDKKHYLGVGSKQTNAKPIKRIAKDEKITENITIGRITPDQFSEIRALYLSTGVTKTAMPTVSYGLYSNGNLFGVFGLSNSYMLRGSKKLEQPSIYLMTDFSVVSTVEKNLSKLVLYCILSKEVKMLAEKVAGKQINSIATNAFSKNPTSMKYRGLFEQFARKVIEKDADGKPTKYNLSYGAPVGQWTIKEAYELWRQKS